MGKIAVFSNIDALGDVSTESAGYFDWAKMSVINNNIILMIVENVPGYFGPAGLSGAVRLYP